MTNAVTRVVASAPGGIGNFGAALDVLGCALAGVRDEVTAEWSDTPGISILDAGHAQLPSDPARHTSAIAASAVLNTARARGAVLPSAGIALTVRKRLPLSGGQGGSAASAVAGAVAVNTLLGEPLTTNDVLACCLTAEQAVSGRHLDNIAPSLLGGIVLVRSLDPIEVVSLPVPPTLCIVLAHPSQQLTTAVAREVLPPVVTLSVAIHQMAQVAAMVVACYAGDVALLGRAMDDRIAEPKRGPMLRGFAEARAAAMSAGAAGAGISGAGPTTFAICDDASAAAAIGHAMRDAYAACGMECDVRATVVDLQGAVAVAQ